MKFLWMMALSFSLCVPIFSMQQEPPISIMFTLRGKQEKILSPELTKKLAAVSLTVKNYIDQAAQEMKKTGKNERQLDIDLSTASLSAINFIEMHIDHLTNAAHLLPAVIEYARINAPSYNNKPLVALQDLVLIARYFDLQLLKNITLNYANALKNKKSLELKFKKDKLNIVLNDNQLAYLDLQNIDLIEQLFNADLIKSLWDTAAPQKSLLEIIAFNANGETLNPLYLPGLSSKSFAQLLTFKQHIFPLPIAISPALEKTTVPQLVELLTAVDYLGTYSPFMDQLADIISKRIVEPIFLDQFAKDPSSIDGISNNAEIDHLIFDKLNNSIGITILSAGSQGDFGLKFIPNSKSIAIGTQQANKQLVLRDIKTNKELFDIQIGMYITNFAISPNGQYIATIAESFPEGSGREILIWDIPRKKRIRTIAAADASILIFNSQSTEIFYQDQYYKIRKIDIATGITSTLIEKKLPVIAQMVSSPYDNYFSCFEH